MNELQSLVDDERGTQHSSSFAIDYISSNTNNSTPEIMMHTKNIANATSETANDTNDTSTPDVVMEESNDTSIPHIANDSNDTSIPDIANDSNDTSIPDIANESNDVSTPDLMMEEQNDIDYFEDLEHDDNDENSSYDYNRTLFGSIEKAKDVALELMDTLKVEFGIDGAKQIIVDTAKVAGIPLFAKRDMSISVDVDINDLERKIQGFSDATLMMTRRSSNVGVVARCIEISQQIKRLDSSSHFAQVAVFVYLLEYSALFKEADDSANHKELNKELQIGLEIKSAAQFSKFRRKCERVKKLCNVLGVAGGCAMGMYVKIYSLENMVNTEFKDMIKDLKMNRQLISFCQTLVVDDTGMPMIRQSTATTASIPSSSTSL